MAHWHPQSIGSSSGAFQVCRNNASTGPVYRPWLNSIVPPQSTIPQNPKPIWSPASEVDLVNNARDPMIRVDPIRAIIEESNSRADRMLALHSTDNDDGLQSIPPGRMMSPVLLNNNLPQQIPPRSGFEVQARPSNRGDQQPDESDTVGPSIASNNPRVTGHRCRTCGKNFMKSSSLVVHLRIHTNTRPFPCLQCGARFRQKSDLKKHLRTYTGEKPYSCHICGMAFSQTSNLYTHRKKSAMCKPSAVPNSIHLN